ncbi:MAG: hypothetical protein COS29_01685 [Candidatus Omnitrophica bacterium CG02_land_8_20_14_3_00__42_8]|nr:MAG: hypothetical protein COS29_01685 [Candidatus Omnitrophica bacterium CG02_land_8_20_14_3_00__42_8]
MFKLALILMPIFIMTSAYACAGAESGLAASVSSCSFSEWVNSQPGNKSIDDNAEKIVLREQWERNIGVDIFYPYFRAKELESKVREKSSVRVFKLKGKPEFKNNEAKYIFSVKF